MAHTDYYAVLGVARGASAADVDRAYRRAARATHPDVHPDDASAAERFHAVAVAYETLGDPRRRAAYDHAHPAVRRSTPAVAPVRLGRRRPRVEPLAAGDDIFELADALSRLVFGRPSL